MSLGKNFVTESQNDCPLVKQPELLHVDEVMEFQNKNQLTCHLIFQAVYEI